MPLKTIDLSISDTPVPEKVATFLEEADCRVNQLVSETANRPSGFVSSNATTVYQALRAIEQQNLSTGRTFCEWGSGLGVAAGLATMLGFESYGIEIEEPLVEAARKLAADFDLPTQFIQGSFIPAGAEACAEQSYADNSSEFLWVVTDADAAYEELGLELDDFDLVFAYPWPGDDSLLANLFDEHAAQEALLLTYDQFNSIQLRRKVGSASEDHSESS
jgi:hypothetical protein